MYTRSIVIQWKQSSLSFMFKHYKWESLLVNYNVAAISPRFAKKMAICRFSSSAVPRDHCGCFKHLCGPWYLRRYSVIVTHAQRPCDFFTGACPTVSCWFHISPVATYTATAVFLPLFRSFYVAVFLWTPQYFSLYYLRLTKELMYNHKKPEFSCFQQIDILWNCSNFFPERWGFKFDKKKITLLSTTLYFGIVRS